MTLVTLSKHHCYCATLVLIGSLLSFKSTLSSSEMIEKKKIFFLYFFKALYKFHHLWEALLKAGLNIQRMVCPFYVLQVYCVHSPRGGDVYSSMTGPLGVEAEIEREKGFEKNQKINHDRNRCKS